MRHYNINSYGKNKLDVYEIKNGILSSYRNIFERIQQVYIFGTKVLGKEVLQCCCNNGIKVIGFIDNDKTIQGQYIEGIRVYQLSEINPDEKYPIIIATLLYCHEIYNQLLKKGLENVIPYPILSLWNSKVFPEKFTLIHLQEDIVENYEEYKKLLMELEDEKSRYILDKIFNFRLTMNYEYMSECCEQIYLPYFDEEILQLNDNEVFLDAGGYIGDTTLNFIEVTQGAYKEILFFEPDKILLEKAKSNLILYSNITFYNKGIYSKSKVLKFNATNNETGKIDSNGNIEIAVVAIDELSSIRPSFIKMDIEGSEMDAINGMRNYIQTYRPKLAISVYHESSDIWKIPKLIRSINANYKFYLRQYTHSQLDTVLYCI